MKPDPARARGPRPRDRARHEATAASLHKAILATLLLAGWGLALSLYAWLGEPGWIEVTHHAVGTPTPGARPLRAVLLADLHLRSLGGRERRVAAAVRAARPDLLVLGGDLVDEADDLPVLDAFLSLLGEPPAAVAVPGSAERWGGVDPDALRDVLAHRGVTLLADAALGGVHGGRRWAVLGLDDVVTGHPDPRRAAGEVAGVPNVLAVSHAPWIRDVWTGPPPAFLLAGNTHGGQVSLLGFAPARPPGSGRYVAGWYRAPPFDAYVTRGVGTSVLPIRFGARPEVAVFDWWLK